MSLADLVWVNGQHSDESVAGSGEDGVVVQRQQAVDRLGMTRKPEPTYVIFYNGKV